MVLINFFQKKGIVIQPYKILVADDEFLIRWSLTQVLSQEGYEVFSVRNGREAIDAIKVQHFDFVITDLFMPELDGWEVLKMTRQIQPSPQVIIVTAHGKEDTKIMARERGAMAYVEKPYIIEEIKEILRKVFKKESGSNFGLNFSPI